MTAYNRFRFFHNFSNEEYRNNFYGYKLKWLRNKLICKYNTFLPLD